MTWTKGKVASFQIDDSANFDPAGIDATDDRLKTWATKKRKGKGGC